MIGELISGALGLGGAIYGGIKAGEEHKKMQDYLNGQNSDNEAFYNKNYYGDYTQRADTQNLMKQTRDMLKRNNEVAANTAVVTGATPDAVDAQKEQNNKVITDTMSNIAAQGQQWKDNIQNEYMNRKNLLSNMQYGDMEGAAQGYESLMGNGIKAVGSAATGLSNSLMTPPLQRSDSEIASAAQLLPTAIKTPTTGVPVTGGVDPSKIQFEVK
jgi:hypothetical protein